MTKKSGGMKRRHIWMSEVLFAKCTRAAARHQLRTGKVTPVAEWMRLTLHRGATRGENQRRTALLARALDKIRNAAD